MTLLKLILLGYLVIIYPICAPAHTRGSGVAILYRSNLFNVVDSSIIFEGHILYLKVEFNNVLYHLYNVLKP